MVLLICIVLRVFRSLRVTRLLLGSISKQQVGDPTTGQFAHGHEVEETHEGHHHRDSCVHWELRVEEQEGDEDHEEALAVKETKELAVFDDAMILELCGGKEGCQREEVESQQVEEGVLRCLVCTEISKADDSRSTEAEDGEEVKDVEYVDEAFLVDVTVVSCFLTFHNLKTFNKLKERSKCLIE